MKKRLVLILSIVIIGILFLMYSIFQERSITQVAGLKENNTTKIVVTVGLGIFQNKIIYKDKKDIDNFLKLIDGNVISREMHQQNNNNGWTDQVDFYSGERVFKSITFSIDDIGINGRWYKIAKGNFNVFSLNKLSMPESSEN